MVEVKLGNTENGHTEVIMENALLNKNFVLKGAYNLLMQLKNKEEE
jgi:cobalt-zinc-cadmium efflux system membrane fusion protein